jgi:hypothetical protein
MDLNAIIDVVLGLVLLYLLLGLICTVINEAVASIFRLRARNLRTRLTEIIDNTGLRTQLAKTGAMRSLKSASGNEVGPSYIPSEAMVSALVDALNPDRKSVVELTLDDLKQAVRSYGEDGLEGGKPVPDSAIQSTLLTLIDEANGDVLQFRADLANWFDGTMDRVGGVYRRWMRVISLLIAVIITLALNADSVRIAKALWHDDALRAQIAIQAEKQSAEGERQQSLQELRAEIRPFPLGWDVPEAPKPLTVEEARNKDSDLYRAHQAALEAHDNACRYLCSASQVIGWLMTALAVSLGAPFWFDILHRFANLRGAGQAPARAATAGSRPQASAAADSAAGGSTTGAGYGARRG